MKTIFTWPEAFKTPEKSIHGEDHVVLTAAALAAWALTHLGEKPPNNFGEVLLLIRNEIGMKKAPTPECLTEFAIEKGWLKPE